MREARKVLALTLPMPATLMPPPLQTAFRRVVLRVIAAAVLLVPAGAGLGADWAVSTDHVSVNFAVSHFDISYVHGRFGKIATAVQFDPEAKGGQVVVTVDADSIDTGNRVLDSVLRSDQFLDSVANPEIRFVSERFVFDGAQLSAVDGTLWLHGTQRPLRLTVDRFVCKDVTVGIVPRHVCGGELRASFKRSDFGMTRFLADVGDEVRLDIGVEASQR
jgi:polyisoprenoid-binding protein YceI